jgi:type I restriction enzyme S subunit
MSEWKTYQLGALARFQRGVTWSKDQETAEPDSSCVPVLRIPNIQDQLDTSNLIWLKGVRSESIKQCAAAKDWVLMVGSNGNPDRVGNCVLITEENEFLFASFLVGIEPTHKTQLCPDYMFRLLRGPEIQRYISDDVQGSTGLSNINLSRLKAKAVEIPSVDEQRRIATILTTLDEVIEATEKLVEKHQQIKAGLMHDLFTRGLWTRSELARGDHKGTPAEATAQEGHLRPTPEEAPGLFQDSPLGLIPKSWRVDSIGSVFEIQLGKMLNKLAKSGRYSATYLGNRAVQWDRIDPSSLEEMDFSPSEREKFSLKFGDLLICEGGDVGRTAMWRGEIENCYYQKAIHRLRPKSDEVIPDFMLRFMRYAKDSGHFANFTSQSSIAHLTQEKLASIPMLVPPPEEQRQLVIRFESIDSKLEAENTHLAKLRQQKQGLMHDLLTGRMRVVAESAGDCHQDRL